MTRSITFRESLLRNVIVMMLVLGGAILITMTIASRTSAKMLSRQIIDTSMRQADAELRLFFDEVERELDVLVAWFQDRPLIDLRASNMERANAMLKPFIEIGVQMSSVMIAEEYGREWMLLRLEDRWRNRITEPTRYGLQSTNYDWMEGARQPEIIGSTAPYDPRERPWFQGAMDILTADPRAKRTSVQWTEPYRFFTTGELGITASVGLRSGDGVNRVIAIDVLLSDLDSYTSQLRVSSNGYLFVLGPSGQFIALPQEGLFESRQAVQAAVMQSPEDVDVPLIRDALRALGDRVGVEALENGAVRFDSEASAWWGEVHEFPLSDVRSLYIAVLVPETDLQGFMPVMRVLIAAIIAVALILAVLRAFMVAGEYSEPIEQLVTDSARMSAGDFDSAVPITTRVREMRVLADAHDSMRGSLRALVKMERDLMIAQQIQRATLPDAMPVIPGYDVAAWNKPADETGGDTYDVIGINARGEITTGGDAVKALFMLADATGHGIGPALSAMEIRSMLRMGARSGEPLDLLAAHLNEQLAADLPDGRFITTWLGQLDARTHTLQCLSAGHGPLLLYRAVDQSWTRMEADAMPFGIVPDLDIELPAPIALQPGDLYAVVSDGIFEAVNASGKQFGIDRICAFFGAHANDQTAQELIDGLLQRLGEFTDNAPPQDDQTIILIRRSG